MDTVAPINKATPGRLLQVGHAKGNDNSYPSSSSHCFVYLLPTGSTAHQGTQRTESSLHPRRCKLCHLEPECPSSLAAREQEPYQQQCNLSKSKISRFSASCVDPQAQRTSHIGIAWPAMTPDVSPRSACCHDGHLLFCWSCCLRRSPRLCFQNAVGNGYFYPAFSNLIPLRNLGEENTERTSSRSTEQFATHRP
jgi:hypothetical protein